MTLARAKQPPLAPGWPVLGNALSLASDVRGFLHAQYEQLGPVFRVAAPGYRYTVMAGLDANLFLMRRGSEHFRSKEFWHAQDEVFGASRSLISMDGPEHARLRKVQKRGYARSSLAGRLDEVIALSEPELAKTKGSVNAHYLMQRVVTKQLGLITAQTDPGDYLDDMIRFVRTTLAAKVTKQRSAFTLLSPRYQRAKARAFELGQRVLEQHRETQNGETQQDDLIGDLLTLHRDDPKFLPEQDLLVAALGPFIAGLDTAASTLAFVLYNLHEHPDVLAGVQEEADDFFSSDRSLGNLKEMSLTYKLVLETLRMYPIAGALTRTATKDFEFAGYLIPAETSVIIATTVPHYLAEYFPEPETFDLERYAPPRNEHRQVGAFAPFGLGAHTCLGTGLAEALILLNLAVLTHFFNLDFSPKDYALRIDPVPTPKPSKDFKVKLRARPQFAGQA